MSWPYNTLSAALLVFGGFLLSCTSSVGSPACIPTSVARLELGFTITHVASHCAAGGTWHAGTVSEDNILLHYDNPKIRSFTQTALKEMRLRDAKIARAVLWYRHAEENSSTARIDYLGVAGAAGGKLPDRMVQNLVAFAEDVRAAGFVRLYVVPGAQGRALPSCRRIDWGDCFEPQFTSLSWSVTAQIINALRSNEPEGLEIVIDIALENCFDPNSGREQDARLETYARYMLKQYKKTFGDSRFVISCIGQLPGRTARTLQALVRTFQELQVKPAAIDLHLYQMDPVKIRQLLRSASSAAATLRIPFDIGETFADGKSIFESVAEISGSSHVPNLRALMIWPRNVESSCPISASPPYDMAQVEIGLGLRTREGSPLPPCGGGGG